MWKLMATGKMDEEVAAQRPRKVLQAAPRGRLVLLEHEVPDPREPVARDRRAERVRWHPRADREGAHRDRRADEVQLSAGRVLMLADVVRPELFERRRAVHLHSAGESTSTRRRRNQEVRAYDTLPAAPDARDRTVAGRHPACGPI